MLGAFRYSGIFAFYGNNYQNWCKLPLVPVIYLPDIAGLSDDLVIRHQDCIWLILAGISHHHILVYSSSLPLASVVSPWGEGSLGQKWYWPLGGRCLGWRHRCVRYRCYWFVHLMCQLLAGINVICAGQLVCVSSAVLHLWRCGCFHFGHVVLPFIPGCHSLWSRYNVATERRISVQGPTRLEAAMMWRWAYTFWSKYKLLPQMYSHGK